MASSSHNPSNTVISSFPYFPRLPWELRAYIWESAISPRNVPIHVKHRFDINDLPDSQTDGPKRVFATASPIPPPALLQTCQEARNHLTHPATRATGAGYYEKVSSSDLQINITVPGQDPAQLSTSSSSSPPGPVRYTWVNFGAGDMIQLSFPRFLPLSADSADFTDTINSADLDGTRATCLKIRRFVLPNIRQSSQFTVQEVESLVHGTSQYGLAHVKEVVLNLRYDEYYPGALSPLELAWRRSRCSTGRSQLDLDDEAGTEFVTIHYTNEVYTALHFFAHGLQGTFDLPRRVIPESMERARRI